MRGGQHANNWRMAELHAKEAPDARGASRAGAQCSIAPATAGSFSVTLAVIAPASRARGRPHGSRDDQDASDHGIHQASTCTWRHDPSPAERRRSVVGAIGMNASVAGLLFRAKAVVLATGGRRAFKITSNSWEYTGDGHALAYDAARSSSTWSSCIRPFRCRAFKAFSSLRRCGEGGVLKNTRVAASCGTTFPKTIGHRRRATKKRMAARRATSRRDGCRSC